MPRKHDPKTEVPKSGKGSAAAKDIEKDLKTFASLEVLRESDGGKILVDNLLKDIVGIIESLGINYKIDSHAELMGRCAELESKMLILRLLTRAKKNRELAALALKEELARPPEDE